MVRVQRSLYSNGNQSCERNRYQKRGLRSISLNIAHTCNFQMGDGDLKNSEISEFEVKKISLRTVLLKITRLWRNKQHFYFNHDKVDSQIFKFSSRVPDFKISFSTFQFETNVKHNSWLFVEKKSSFSNFVVLKQHQVTA